MRHATQARVGRQRQTLAGCTHPRRSGCAPSAPFQTVDGAAQEAQATGARTSDRTAADGTQPGVGDGLHRDASPCRLSSATSSFRRRFSSSIVFSRCASLTPSRRTSTSSHINVAAPIPCCGHKSAGTVGCGSDAIFYNFALSFRVFKKSEWSTASFQSRLSG
jgi:hypothetical protein